MLRIVTDKRNIGIPTVLALAILCAAALLSGCGSSEPEMQAGPSTTPTAGPAHTAATGPAVDEALPFEAFAFDSPVKHTTDTNGLEFLQFRYTDKQGRVFECVLPAAMAQGKRKPDAWLGVFDVYKKPQVLAQKKQAPKDSHISDLPLISPKPQDAPKTEPNAPQPNINVPTAPMGPAPPSASPAGPTMPGPTMPGRPSVDRG